LQAENWFYLKAGTITKATTSTITTTMAIITAHFPTVVVLSEGDADGEEEPRLAPQKAQVLATVDA